MEWNKVYFFLVFLKVYKRKKGIEINLYFFLFHVHCILFMI